MFSRHVQKAVGRTSNGLPQIVLFGDSITEYSFYEETQGFGWYLKSRCEGKVEVVNEGYAGYTSEHISRDFTTLLAHITQPTSPPVPIFTILLGANDACFLGPNSEYVPLPKFTENIRSFVDAILAHEKLAGTKIVLITTPPINIPEPKKHELEGEEIDDDDDEDEETADADLGPSFVAAMKASRPNPKEARAYKTYMSKKRYAERIMEIAREYEGNGRVVGVDIWTALVDAGLRDQGRGEEKPEQRYDEDRLPGCGLRKAKAFEKGYFTDGLHLDKRGYSALTTELLKVVEGKWPGLLSETVGEA